MLVPSGVRRRWPRSWVRPEAGDTLIEVLVAMVIMGIAFVIIVGGIATAIIGSDFQKQQAGADVALRTAAEAMPYQPCPATYVPDSVQGFDLTASVNYWNTTSKKFDWNFDLDGCPAVDIGLQLVTLTATPSPTSGRAASPQELQVVKRGP